MTSPYAPRNKNNDDIIEDMIKKDHIVKPSLYQLENFKNYRKKIGLAKIRNHKDDQKTLKKRDDVLANI